MSSPATAGNETDWSMENLTMIDMSFYTSLKVTFSLQYFHCAFVACVVLQSVTVKKNCCLYLFTEGLTKHLWRTKKFGSSLLWKKIAEGEYVSHTLITVLTVCMKNVFSGLAKLLKALKYRKTKINLGNSMTTV